MRGAAPRHAAGRARGWGAGTGSAGGGGSFLSRPPPPVGGGLSLLGELLRPAAVSARGGKGAWKVAGFAFCFKGCGGGVLGAVKCGASAGRRAAPPRRFRGESLEREGDTSQWWLGGA